MNWRSSCILGPVLKSKAADSQLKHALPFFLALALGAALSWRSQSLGLSPWHMTLWPGALAALALIAAAQPLPALPKRTDALLAGLSALPLLAQAWMPEWLFSLLWALPAFFALRAVRGHRPHLASWLLAPLGLLLGVSVPALAALSWGVLLLLPQHAPPDRRGLPLLPMAIAAGAGALGATAWTVARPLDPTLLGLGVSLSALAFSAALSAQLTQRLPPRPILLSVAALGTCLVLAALPHRSALWIDPLAGAQDPRLRVLLLMAAPALPAGLALGGALGPNRQQGLPWVLAAACLGACASLAVGPQVPALFLGLALAGGLLTLSIPAPTWLRISGALAVLGGGLIFALLPWQAQALAQLGTEDLRSPGSPSEARRLSEQQGILASDWSANGSWLLYGEEGRPVRMERDGRTLPRGGRAASTRLLLPHLGAALAASNDSALILGDPWGELSAGLLAQEVNQVTLAVTQPSLTQALAGAEPSLNSVWLHPSMRLSRGSAEEVLRGTGPVDLVLESTDTPWRDGVQGLPSPAGLALRSRSLTQGGVYLLSVPVLHMDEAELRGLMGHFAASFEHTMVFLPPEGADQLIFAGWHGPERRSWDRVVQASVRGGELLASVGIQAPLDLADLGLAPMRGGLLERGDSAYGWMRLGPNLHRRPRMLPPIFLPYLGTPSWLDAPPEVLAALDLRTETNRALLECLDSAARGEIQDVVDQCRALGKSPGGERRLDPLIAPQLAEAGQALERGDFQGCLREVEQARLLNPRSAAAHALAGKCNLAQGDRRRAKEDFEEAERLEPANLDALLGLAQLAVARGEELSAERALQSAAQRNPMSWRPPYYLGMLLLDQGRLEEADGQLATARGLAGRDSTLPLAGLAHVAILQNEPQLALTQARLAADQEPSARNLHLVGWAYLSLGSPDAARPFLERAILADSNYLPAHADLGRIFAIQGEYSMAIDAFDRVLALEPNNPAAIQNRQRAVALLELESQGQ